MKQGLYRFKFRKAYSRPIWAEINYEPLTIDEVAIAVREGRTCKLIYSESNEVTREWHVERVAHFVLNGWNDPISIDVGIPEIGYTTSYPVDDGNHRLAAAIFLKVRTISANLSGSVKFIRGTFGVKP